MTGILSCVGMVVAADEPGAPDAIQVAGLSNAVSQNKAIDYPTEAKRIPLEQGQVYSGLTWQQARAGVPEIRLLKKTTEAIEYVGPMKDLLDNNEWQESPSRIIYHDGKYHTWVMNIWDRAGGGKPHAPGLREPVQKLLFDLRGRLQVERRRTGASWRKRQL